MWVIFGYEEQTFFSKRVTGCLSENTGNYNKLLCSVLLFANTKIQSVSFKKKCMEKHGNSNSILS